MRRKAELVAGLPFLLSAPCPLPRSARALSDQSSAAARSRCTCEKPRMALGEDTRGSDGATAKPRIGVPRRAHGPAPGPERARGRLCLCEATSVIGLTVVSDQAMVTYGSLPVACHSKYSVPSILHPGVHAGTSCLFMRSNEKSLLI